MLGHINRVHTQLPNERAQLRSCDSKSLLNPLEGSAITVTLTRHKRRETVILKQFIRRNISHVLPQKQFSLGLICSTNQSLPIV